ncbi:hypothetical protein [Phytoactinopolyspora mesophila]|uniref:Uncharacterized protein n=1 Tax=Phytoactinopolyspora mesophila TaxID=2650750 RepID=A0A7K3LY23_9ACTN|nr:hypothetical protein [Phytoactinopolyspora mesophila]NDL55880.1 hypothetical protein [Phytoactinopolyspora mesophila]
MAMRRVDETAIRRWALRAAAASARLERREVPDGHVRSREVEEFLESTQSTASKA